MSTPKVKGLFKGFKHLTRMFDNEKEPEMQIGCPTDVKHVAHIGWDGPSVNTPSWMNEFKAPSSCSSSPSDERASKDSKSVYYQGRDLPDLPKSPSRQSTGSVTDSPTREKSDKPKQPRKSAKPRDHNQGRESPGRDLLDIPKKSRRKKSKEISGGGGPSKSRLKASHRDPNSGFGSSGGPVHKSN